MGRTPRGSGPCGPAGQALHVLVCREVLSPSALLLALWTSHLQFCCSSLWAQCPGRYPPPRAYAEKGPGAFSPEQTLSPAALRGLQAGPVGPQPGSPSAQRAARLFVMTKSWEWEESLHHDSGDPVAPASRHGLSQALLHRSDPTGCLYFTPVPQNLWSSYPFLVGRDIIAIVSYAIVCSSGNHFSRSLGGGLEYILTKSLRGILSSQGPPGGSVITQEAGPAPYSTCKLPHPASPSIHSFTIYCPLGAPGSPETPTCGILLRDANKHAAASLYVLVQSSSA